MMTQAHSYKVVDSTNAEANRLLMSKMNRHPFTVVADFQTAGRGQGIKSWESQDGKNILMSWVIFPEFLSVDRQFYLSKMVSLGLCDFLGDYSISALIKWPNDIIVGNYKIAGILIENSILGNKLNHCIIGIGLNVNQSHFSEFDYPAISMKNIGGANYKRDELLIHLDNCLRRRYQQLEAGDEALMDKEYHKKMYGFGRNCKFEEKGKAFEALIKGVNQYGELLLEKDGEVVNYGFHQLKFIF